MLLPSPEGCAIASAIHPDPKMDDDNFFFFKKIGTWVGEVGGGVNADDRCDQ